MRSPCGKLMIFVSCSVRCPRVISADGVCVGRIPDLRMLSGPSYMRARA